MKISYKRLLRLLIVVIIMAAIVSMVNQVLTPFGFSYLHINGQRSASLIVENKQHNDYIMNSLQHQIHDLQSMLDEKNQQLEAVQRLNEADGDKVELPVDNVDVFIDGDKVLHYMKDQIDKSAILKNTEWKNEYDINQFTMFDRSYIYKLDLGLKMRPQDIIASRHDWEEEFKEVIKQGIDSLNNGRERSQVSPTYVFTEQDFLHGFFRTETNTGTQYILVYQPMSSSNIVNKHLLFDVELFRPFAPLQEIKSAVRHSNEKIYFVVPLQGREDTLRLFLEYFKDFAITADGNVFLLVVYYGSEGLRLVQHYLEVLGNSTGFQDYKILNIQEEEFSRGRALQHGAMSLENDTSLMFFCDVDIGFSTELLNQCRSHTIAGKSVFYPVVFSLFNPELVYQGQPVPAFRDRRILKRDNGMWRDFGFGMTCQYLSDFKNIGGFDLSINGWGSEDTLLYRKYTQTNKVRVIRSPVNSLFHHWHTKHCDKSWAQDQYEACLRSRARTEASQKTLGMLYLQLKEKLSNLSSAQDDMTP